MATNDQGGTIREKVTSIISDVMGTASTNYPRNLNDGIDEMETCLDAFGAVAQLLEPVVAGDRVDLRLVDRGKLAALLDLLTVNAQWQLRRARADVAEMLQSAKGQRRE